MEFSADETPEESINDFFELFLNDSVENLIISKKTAISKNNLKSLADTRFLYLHCHI